MFVKTTIVSPGPRIAAFFAALFVAAAINTAFLPLWFADCRPPLEFGNFAT